VLTTIDNLCIVSITKGMIIQKNIIFPILCSLLNNKEFACLLATKVGKFVV
jgi:hypothetical protein